MNILVSACLLGMNCRYDGSGSLNEDVAALMDQHHLIPVCPEQLGGMETPRMACERLGELVIDQLGDDVTRNFERGAGEVWKLAELYGCDYAVLKERSPSCGNQVIYDGSFTKKVVSGDGVTAELLKGHGVMVVGESRVSGFFCDMTRKVILETDRLLLRELHETDLQNLNTTLRDESVMYAYEHAFGDEEVRAWLDQQLGRYKMDGFGLWAVILKDTGAFIGQCGITVQEWEGRQIPEIGYLLSKAYWHKGYATEAAMACKEYGFSKLGMTEIYSLIRNTNTASQNVARRNGMTVCGRQMKHYYNMDMPHLVFCVKKGLSDGDGAIDGR